MIQRLQFVDGLVVNFGKDGAGSTHGKSVPADPAPPEENEKEGNGDRPHFSLSWGNQDVLALYDVQYLLLSFINPLNPMEDSVCGDT
jgi:hypothetical protein